MNVKVVRTASAAVVASALALSLLAPRLLAGAGSALILIAALAGLPHGAADVVLLTADRSRGIITRARWLLAYAVVAALVVVVALAQPSLVLAALLVLSVAHFAEGEAAFDRLAGGKGCGLAALAIATSIIALPPAVHPDQVRTVLEPLAPGLSDLMLSDPGRLLLGALAAGLIGCALLRAPGLAKAEVALVAALAVVAPPLVAFAAWFAGWHAVRHLCRLVVIDGRADASGRLLRATILPSLGGLALLAALVLVGDAPAPAVLLGLLALTVPHAVVVEAALGRRAQDGLSRVSALGTR